MHIPNGSSPSSILHSRLPTINRILSQTGYASLSIGLSISGSSATHHLSNLPALCPDDGTLYGIGSLTKSFTSAALGLLIAEGRLSWSTSLHTLLPSFPSSDPTTVRDILCHRTGRARLDVLWQPIHSAVWGSREDAVDAFLSLPQKIAFREGFWYNNCAYALGGAVIEAVTGERWDRFIESKILGPLGMKRTTAVTEGWDNVASGYVVLPDLRAEEVEQPEISGATLIGAAGAMRSSVSDMLKWGRAVLDGLNNGDGVLKEMGVITGGHNVVVPGSQNDALYGLGWSRKRFPSALPQESAIGILRDPGRAVSAGANGCEGWSMPVISHGGMVPGFTSELYLIPHIDAVVVVLSNAETLGTAVEFVAQDIIQALPSPPHFPVDFIAIAAGAAARRKRWFRETFSAQPCPSPRPTDSPDGKYYLESFPKYTMVVESGHVSFGAREDQRHRLEHWHFDTWRFGPENMEEYLAKGYAAWEYKEEFWIRFERDVQGEIVGAVWVVEGGVEVRFRKNRE